MGLQDRDYYRRRGRSGTEGVSRLSINTWLIVINIAVFGLEMLMPRRVGLFPFETDALFDYGHFSTYMVTLHKGGGLEFWRFLTFQFLHSSPVHIGFNMLGLYVFGGMVEEHLGRKKYLAFYLTCGVFGAFTYLLLNAAGSLLPPGQHVPFLLIGDTRTPLIGASAGVLGTILACAYIAPDTQIQLMFPPIIVRIKILAYFYVIIAIITLFFGGGNAGGEAAHLGGAAAGYFFIRNSHLLRDFFDVFTDSRKQKARPNRPGFPPAGLSQRERDDLEKEVNRILDKARDQGVNSLTEAEKATLARDTDTRARP
jgi:membrane associated rhomboid family serine protease